MSQVNPQPDDPHIRIVHTVYREIIRRKFTARQHSIIDFILTLSWGCGKPSAIIPRLKDFGLCGVRPNHIRKELQILSAASVIFWDESMNAFQLNKHHDQWDVPIVEEFDKKEMDRLINYNIEVKSPNLKKLPEKGSDFPKEEVEELPEKGTNFPKRETETSQKGKSKLPEKGSRLADKASHSKRFGAPKASIKAIIKYSSSTKRRYMYQDTEQAAAASDNDFSFSRIYKIYENHFTKRGTVTEFEVQDLGAMFDDYGGEWVYAAMREAARHQNMTLAYVNGVLKGFKQRGGTSTSRASPGNGAVQSEYQLDDDDPITQMLRREGARHQDE